jgi:hypothetical protein
MSEAVANLTMFSKECQDDAVFLDVKRGEAENELRDRNK